MSTTDPTEIVASRDWLISTLDDAGRRLDLADQAGVTTVDPSWTDDHGITVTVVAHGNGITLTAKSADGHTLVDAVTMPRGWTAA